MAKQLKIGDRVWVNERSLSGKLLKHEWQGEVTKVLADGAEIKDCDPNSSYYGQTFPRFFQQLELKG